MDKAHAFVLLMLCLDLEFNEVKLMPICANVSSGCHVLTVAELFDRVIQHSSRIHSLSTDLFLDLEKYFLSGRNDLERSPHKCHTSTLQTPNGKETAQNIPREELTYLIMSLLQAWKKPLSQFHQNIENYQEISETGQSKAQEISSMMRELEKGVEKVTAKMQSMGIINNSLHRMTSSSDSVGLPGTNDSAMTDYELLLCFRRDTNKVQSYLNILKCRVEPENTC